MQQYVMANADSEDGPRTCLVGECTQDATVFIVQHSHFQVTYVNKDHSLDYCRYTATLELFADMLRDRLVCGLQDVVYRGGYCQRPHLLTGP